MIFQFLFVQLLLTFSTAFTEAPGRVTLKVGLPEMIDGCLGRKCSYILDICIGSVKSIEDHCSWVQSKRYEGIYTDHQKLLAQLSFYVDNVRSSFNVNANWTILIGRNVVTTMKFKDCIIKYDVSNGTKSESHYSESFESMTSEINVECKSGFYPQYQCTRSCFGVPGQYFCDSNGKMICVQEYVWDKSASKCVKDACRSNTSVCQNNSTCVNRITSVSCLCSSHYHGKYCQIAVDPCRQTTCSQGCQVKSGVAVCLKADDLKSIVDNIGLLRVNKQIKSTQTPLSRVDQLNVVMVGEDNSKLKETVKLVQYPIQKDYTTIAVIVALVVFMVFCLGVSFWMQRYAYFQKKKKYNINTNIPTIPSLINTPTYRSADDNFKRWHSLDDSSFYICHQPHNEHFATMSYKSGSNIWPRYDNNQDIYRDCYRNWPQTMKTRMPMMSESNHLESDNSPGNFYETSQNNSEKMENFVPGTLFLDPLDRTI